MPSSPDPSAFIATLAAVTNLNRVATGVIKLFQMVRSQFGQNWSGKTPEQRRADRLLDARVTIEEKKILMVGDYDMKEYKLRREADLRKVKIGLKQAETPPPDQDIVDIDVLLLDSLEPDLAVSDQRPFEFVEQRRLNNTKHVLRHAIGALPEHDEISGNPVNPDLQARIFGTVQDVSTAEMQELWGRLLAGEIARPGSFSLRTLDVLRNLSLEEARLFEKVCQLCTDAGVLAIPVNGDDTIIPYESLMHLVECGLIYQNTPPRTPVDLVHFHGEKGGMKLKFGRTSISVSGIHNTIRGLSWMLTSPGMELRRVCASRIVDDNLFEAYCAEIRKQGATVEVVREADSGESSDHQSSDAS